MMSEPSRNPPPGAADSAPPDAVLAASPGDGGYELVIEAGRAERRYWSDLWLYRELFAILAWRDLMVRYKQTAIGVAWALIQPFTAMVVFTVIFGTLAGMPSGGAPYSVMVYAGLLPWQFFATALTACSTSLNNNAPLLTKVYFPRLVIPTSSVVVSLVDFALSFLILGALMAWHQYWPPWRVVLLPAFIAVAFACAMGAGLWFASLNVAYRDFRYVVPFVVQLGLYVSPVGFSSEVVPERFRFLYSLNPMVGVIDGFRWCLLGGEGTPALYWPGLAVSVALVAALLASGLWFFRRVERTFADII